MRVTFEGMMPIRWGDPDNANKRVVLGQAGKLARSFVSSIEDIANVPMNTTQWEQEDDWKYAVFRGL